MYYFRKTEFIVIIKEYSTIILYFYNKYYHIIIYYYTFDWLDNYKNVNLSFLRTINLFKQS